jgi:acyl-CoA thioesterase-1
MIGRMGFRIRKCWLRVVVCLGLMVSASPGTTVLVLGDSLAAGLGVEREEAFPSVVQELAKKDGKEIEVINGGVSGDTSAGGLRRIGWLLNRPVDVLLLELGANDGLRGIAPESTASNLQGIIDAARKKYPELRVVIAGMKMPPNLGEEYGAKFEAVFPALAKKNDAALVPFLLEGVGGVPEFNQGDRIHPNAEGHRILAGNVWVVLKKVLDEG